MLRRQAATLPGKEAVLKQVSLELAEREKGLIPGDTAEQAQAQLCKSSSAWPSSRRLRSKWAKWNSGVPGLLARRMVRLAFPSP